MNIENSRNLSECDLKNKSRKYFVWCFFASTFIDLFGLCDFMIHRFSDIVISIFIISCHFCNFYAFDMQLFFTSVFHLDILPYGSCYPIDAYLFCCFLSQVFHFIFVIYWYLHSKRCCLHKQECIDTLVPFVCLCLSVKMCVLRPRKI